MRKVYIDDVIEKALLCSIVMITIATTFCIIALGITLLRCY